jgi:hypothetical protein
MNQKKNFKKLQWVITGEFITRMARDWVLERRWDESIKWLRDSLEGIDYGHIMSILSGEAKLVGDSTTNIFLEKEDLKVGESYKKDYMFLYCGIYKEQENHYQPYAVVTDYGEHDIWGAHFEYSGIFNSGVYSHNREMFYATNQKTDKSFLLYYNNNVDVPHKLKTLWKLVDKPPLWVNCHSEPQEALDEYLHYHNGLEIRGYSVWSLANSAPFSSKLLPPKKYEKQKQEEIIKEEEQYQKQIRELHTQIVNQTKSWISLHVKEKEFYIPREPFEHWALKRTSGYHLAPEWQVVSPSGMKMYCDDPYHTDWVIGAGISLDDVYSHKNQELENAIYNLMQCVQVEKLNFQCAILCGRGKVEGETYHPSKNQEVPVGSIIVIPHASTDYYKAMMSACRNGKGAVIAQTGGVLCHLTNEARQNQIRMIVVENALIKFPPHTKVIVNCDEGKVHVSMLKNHFLE